MLDVRVGGATPAAGVLLGVHSGRGKDARLAALAARQFNRFSLEQLRELGFSDRAVAHRVAQGRLVIVEEAVLAIAPVLDHDWGRWMGATLTEPATRLGGASAGAAYGFWAAPRHYEVVIRPGSGGPRRIGGLLVCRSTTLEGESTELRGIPITTVERTLLDLARSTNDRACARAVREAIRLGLTNVGRLGDALETFGRRSGKRRLTSTLARYTGLPLERARSGAEIRAMELLRQAGRPMPRLNARIAGEEADLSWQAERLIIEIDGGPFHLDVGEDARKQAAWERAGWTVRRLPSGDIYRYPQRLLSMAPPPTVPTNVHTPPLQGSVVDVGGVGGPVRARRGGRRE